MTFYKTIVYISIFQYSLFAFFLLISSCRKILSNKILAFFLICKALCYCDTALWKNREFAIVHIPYLFYIGHAFDLLLGPSIFFYIKSLMDENLKFTKKDLVHTVPFFVYLLAMFILFHRFDIATKNQMLTNGFLGRPGRSIYYMLLYAPFIFYSGACIVKINQYKKHVQDHYACIQRKKVQWMQFLVAGLMVIWILAVTKQAFKFFGAAPPVQSYFIIICLFIFANAIFFTGFSSQDIFLPIPEKPVAPQKYLKNPIDEMDRDHMLHRIVSVMEEEKPFFDPEFNLQKLSHKTGIKPHRISQVINTGLGKNFYDLVNGYRVAESKKLLEKNVVDNDARVSDKKTVSEIIYEVGFNSKSAFHRAFKKHTGMTPTMFSRSMLEK